jgi:hypothetical protein
MQNKAARKAARQANIALGLSMPPDQAERKYGAAMKPARRDFHKIMCYIENQARRSGINLPKEISAPHFQTVKKLIEIAHRDNNFQYYPKCPKCKENVEVVCKTCGTSIDIMVPSEKLERNSVMCLEALLDRFAPKLATQSTEINIHQNIINMGSGIAQIISQYVPNDKLPDCMIQIRSLLGTFKNATTQQ